MMLTADIVRELLDYDPDTGALTWRVKRHKVQAGELAGARSPNSRGYLTIRIMGRTYQTHRVVWLIHHGRWPDGEVDHINMDKTDNRIANLRVVTRAQNMLNRKAWGVSGVRGVTRTMGGKWQARVCGNKKAIYLGNFETPEEAHAAVLAHRRDCQFTPEIRKQA